MNAMIHRSITDANFEHCAKTLLPMCIELCRALEEGQELDHNTIGCIHIVAEVAEVLAREMYGKPKWKVPAGRYDMANVREAEGQT